MRSHRLRTDWRWRRSRPRPKRQTGGKLDCSHSLRTSQLALPRAYRTRAGSSEPTRRRRRVRPDPPAVSCVRSGGSGNTARQFEPPRVLADIVASRNLVPVGWQDLRCDLEDGARAALALVEVDHSVNEIARYRLGKSEAKRLVPIACDIVPHRQDDPAADACSHDAQRRHG